MSFYTARQTKIACVDKFCTDVDGGTSRAVADIGGKSGIGHGMAALHIAMAFPMVKRLLALFSMTNSGLFARCTVVTLLVFALVYGVIYGLTAKVYYKIVERK